MDRSMVFFKKGELIEPLNASEFKRAISQFSEGDKIMVTIRKHRRTHELSQKAVFYMYCRLVADETGSDFTEVANALMYRFGSKEMSYKFMRSSDPFVSKSLEDYETVEMSEMLSKIHAHIVFEMGIEVPEPKELKTKNY